MAEPLKETRPRCHRTRIRALVQFLDVLERRGPRGG